MSGRTEKIREKAVELNCANDLPDEILALVGDAPENFSEGV